MKTNFKKFIALFLAVTTLTACGTQKPIENSSNDISTQAASSSSSQESSKTEENKTEAVTIKTFDYSRNHIELEFDKIPERVITYSLNSLENMLALGLGDKIVMAMSVSEDEILPKYREEFKKVKNVSESFISKEEAIALEPDFILAWYSSFSDKRFGDVGFWHERGIKTYMAYNSACVTDDDYEYVTNDYIEREYLDILNLGKIFHVEDKAEDLVNQMKAKVEKGKEYAKLSDQKNVVILEDEGDVFRIYGEDTIGGQIATEVGANLVAKTRKERKSAEELIALNPDIIFGVHFGENSTSLNDKNCFDCFKNNPALQNIEAYKKGNLFPTDLSLVYSPGVRLLESFDFFINSLYPDLVAKENGNYTASESNSYYPVTITNYDYAGNEFTTTYEKCPEKVLAVYQGSIETMIALGLEDKVIASYGLDNEVKDIWKDGLSKMHYDASVFAPDKETVVAMNPDMIFSWGSIFSDKNLGDVSEWQERGTNCYMNTNTRRAKTPRTIQNECDDLINIGKIFNVQDKAEALVKEMQDEIAKALKETEGKEAQRVAVVEIGKDNIRNYHKNSLAGDMVKQLGAELILPETGNMSKEELIAENPDKIFVVFMAGDKNIEEAGIQHVEKITKDPALQSLKAVQNNNVFPIMLGDMYASTVRTIDGIRTISKGLYPELYK